MKIDNLKSKILYEGIHPLGFHCQQHKDSLKAGFPQDEINGRVSYGRDGLYKAPQGQILISLLNQLMPQSFFASCRLDKKSGYKEDNPQYRQSNPQPLCQIYKQFACQGYSKYGFRNICKVACDKLSSISLNDFHWGKVYHSLDALSSNAYANIAPPLAEHLTEQYEFSDTQAIWLDGVADFSLRSLGRALKCATPQLKDGFLMRGK